MKFYGEIGYGYQVEGKPGVHEVVITERRYFGEVTQGMLRFSEGADIHPGMTMANTISIVADAYAYEHIHAIRYVRWSGSYWLVVTAQVQAPRLSLRLGGVYNGPKA